MQYFLLDLIPSVGIQATIIINAKYFLMKVEPEFWKNRYFEHEYKKHAHLNFK